MFVFGYPPSSLAVGKATTVYAYVWGIKAPILNTSTPMDEANLIMFVEVSNEWTNFRQQLSEDMYDEYLLRHVELEME